MTNTSIGLGVIKLCVLGLLGGCASTTTLESTGPELNDESLDVLFATEFPVESEADAILRATQALQKGDVDEALFFYVRALQFRPQNVELIAQIGEIQMQQENFDLASSAFLTAREYDPGHARSLEGLGLIYMAKGMHDQAIIEFQAAVANDNQLWRAHNALGVYEDKAGEFAAAQLHYDLALAINPEAAGVLNNRGYSKLLAGDIPGATVDLYEAAENRLFHLAWANLGRLYATQGQYGEAVSTYKHVMSEAHALNNTAKAAIENGDMTRAIVFLNRAIELSPTYFPAAEENLSLIKERELDNGPYSNLR
jgi:tetratricopeptide (TPR) repeat protein